MIRPKRFPAFLLAIVGIFASAAAVWAIQTRYIDVNAVVSGEPTPRVTLTWDAQVSGNLTANVTISRRVMGEEGVLTWQVRGTVTPPNAQFIDQIEPGVAYEYRIARSAVDSTYIATTAFVAVSWNAPLKDERGKILLVRTNNANTTALANELRLLEMDLVGDGWTVVPLATDPHTTTAATNTARATALRSAIQTAYNEDPENTKALYIFGRAPIVRSGYTQPDGHQFRAHATDGFYADIDGEWTDSTVNQTGVNILGDGIYDPSYFPSKLELMTGRVDLAGMTGYRKHEREMLRDYLHKSHAFRSGLRTELVRRASWREQSLWMERNWLHPLFGSANVTISAFQPLLATTPQVWAIDFGQAESSTSLLYTDTPTKAIFTMNFGSGKLIWDADNSQLRALLAQPDWGLSCVWGARPAAFFHHMGTGETLGYSALRTMNNNSQLVNMEYQPAGTYNWMAGYVHQTLMGDPTLRLHPVTPPRSVQVSRSGPSAILSWTAAIDPAVTGYHVYRSSNRLGPYERLTVTPTAALTFTDPTVPAGEVYYQVRSIKTELTAAASYSNSSQGRFAWLRADGTPNRSPVATPSSITASSNQPRDVLLVGSDPDGDTLTPIVTRNPANGELRWTENQVVYVPRAGYVGPDSVQFVLFDGVALSEPVEISINVGSSKNLLEWSFINPAANVPQVLTSTMNASGVQPSVIDRGSGFSWVWSNASGSVDAIFLNGGGTTPLSPTRYLEWTVTPAQNQQLRLERVSFGLWSSSSNITLHAQLRWSTDGFATWQDVPLGPGVFTSHIGRGTSSFFGTPASGDLSGLPGLQDVARPVTFRLFIWGTALGATTPFGLGKLGSARADLIVSGTTVPLSYANWAATHPWQGANSSATADPDGDGITNRLEFLLGRNPLISGTVFDRFESQPAATPGRSDLIIEMRRRKNVGGLFLQSSTNLTQWTDMAVNGTTLIEEIIQPDPLGDGSVEDIRLRVPETSSPSFLRFRAP